MTSIRFIGTDGSVHAECSLPSSWEEMTHDQVRFVFEQYGACCSGEVSPLELNVRILLHLLGTKPSRALAGSDRACENVYRLCLECLGFLFKEDDGQDFPQLSFSSPTQHLPVAGSGKRRLYGPESGLADLPFRDFRHAANALSSFFSSKDNADLDECIAWLYRRRASKPDSGGRRLRPFGPEAVSDAGQLPSWQKTLIMLWFSACIRFIQSGSVRLNGETVDLALLFSSGTDDGPAFTWNDMALQIARNGGIGDLDKVDGEPLYSILAIMWSNYKENKRYERIAKSKKA